MPAETHYVYQVAMRQRLSQGAIINVLHARRFDTTDPATTAQLLAFANAFKESIRQLQPTQTTWVDWVATQVAGPGVTYSPTNCRQIGGLQISGAFTGTLTGGAGAGEALPAKDCLVITERTGERGRSRRGRIYTAGYAEGAQAEGVWTTVFLGQLAVTFDVFHAAYKASGTNANLRYVVFSRIIASGCKPNPLERRSPLRPVSTPDQSDSWREVASYDLQAPVFSQRSRTAGRGV